MTDQLVVLVAHYGLLIVGTNVLLDQVGLPVPAMPTLIVAGAFAAQLAATRLRMSLSLLGAPSIQASKSISSRLSVWVRR